MTRFHFTKREEHKMIRFHRPDPSSGSEPSDRAPYRAQHRRRDLSLRLLGFAIALVVCLLVAGYPPSGGVTPAHADTTCTDSSGNPCAPPPLLNGALLTQPGGLYSATAAQQQSLSNLEQQAAQNTIQDHQLPSSDATAVQSWGQDDAEAELWHLLVQAIQTQPGSRTTDQQNAVDWLTAVQKRDDVLAAQDAGLEYVKWAGLDQKYYQSLIASGADETTLENFLKGTPVNYNLIDSNGNPINAGSPTSGIDLSAAGQSTGGYCVYRSPAHDYSTVYNNNIFQNFDTTHTADSTCYAPCPVANCPVTPPSYNNFVEWGATDANDAFFGSDNTATDGSAKRMQNIAIGTGFGLYAGGFVAGISIGATLLGSYGSGVALASFILPFASSVFAAVLTVAALVVIVVIAIVVAAIYSYQLFNAIALPGQLADLITTAPKVDLPSLLQDNSTGLFSLFVGATGHTPSNSTCDNSQITVASTNSLQTAPCLNAPPVPSAAPNDPQFAIQQQGATTWTNASSISWKDTAEKTSTTGRLHGNWFVDQVTDTSGTTTTKQTLRIQYTDWSGNEKVAWLLTSPSSGPMFLGYTDGSASGAPLDPSTCHTDGTCSASSTINYVGTDGQHYTAKVVPTAPQVAPTFDANPVEGSPVTFHANGSSPVGSSLTYQWTFAMPSPASSSTCIAGLGNTCSGPTVSASGATASNTWTTSGTYHGTLTATDAQGRSTVYSFSVSVGDVAPTLSLAPACPTVLSSPCDVRSVAPGSATTLTGSITHTGSADTETVDINWGDGTAHDTTTVPQSGPTVICVIGCSTPNPTITQASGTLDTFSGTHTYASPGSYTVTVKVTDQGGGTETQTTTETVQYVSTVAWTQPQPITYGTALDATQLDAAASATGAASVPGSFAYSVDGTPVTASDNKVLPAGPHTLKVQFTPTDTSTYTTPAAVTVPLQVNPAPLTITAGSPSVIYTGSVPAINPSYSGFVNKESPDSLSTKPTCASTAPSSGAVGSYATSCSGAVDPNYQFSYVPGTLTITKAATSLSLGTSGSPVMQGNSVTFTATVAVTAPGAGTPTGTVTFKDGTTTLGTGQLTVVNGQDQATFTTKSLGLGQHTITASYGGDGNFTGSSTSGALTQNIDTNLGSYPKLSSGAYNLSNANLSGGYFAGANLAGASLTGANLTNAVFTGANLTGANLSNSNFISGANFTGANLSNANLSNSNLKGANFTNVNLTGANLSGSNLKGATGLKTATLTNVIWSNTACPDGSNSSSDGGTCVGHL